MKIIGITGSIGAGKSTAGKMLSSLAKAPLFDADLCVHQLLSKPSIQIKLGQFLCHRGIMLEKHLPLRHQLSQLIELHSKMLFYLEEFFHPLVIRKKQDFFCKARLQRRKMVVLDIPLLWEAGFNKYCDVIITVKAPSYMRKKRVFQRKNMTSQKWKIIEQRQFTQHKKIALSDLVIHSGLGKALTYRQLKCVLKGIYSCH